MAAFSSRQESFEAIVQGYAARHKVGPASPDGRRSMAGRGEIDDPAALKARVEYDLYYIENWSLRLDLYILAITPAGQAPGPLSIAPVAPMPLPIYVYPNAKITNA